MKRKKLFAAVLTASMCITTLAGCGNKEEAKDTTTGSEASSQETEQKDETAKADDTAEGKEASDTGNQVKITFWNMFAGGEGDFCDQIVKDFNESQSEVEVEAVRLEPNEFYAKYGAALASGKGPDVAVTHSDKLAPFVSGGQLAELDSLADAVGFDFSEISDLNMDAVAFDGKHYSVPIDTHFHLCYYNKEILQQAGKLKEDGTPDFGDLTPEGFTKFLEEIKTAVPDKQPFSVNTPYFNQPFYNLYYEAGGNILSEDFSKADINNEKAKAVLDFYMNAYDTGLADINDVNPWDTFANGESAIWFGGVWEAGNFFSEENGDKFGAVALPAIFGSESHWASSHGLTVPEYTDPQKKEAAMKFMVYFSTQGAQIWGNAGHVPACTAIAESDEYQALPYRDEFVKAQKTVKFAPPIDNYNAVDTVITEQLQTIIFKEVTVEEGLNNIEEEVNSLLQ